MRSTRRWERHVAAAFRAVAVGCVAALAWGCGAELPPPAPERVEPDWAYNGEDTRIDVYGSQFYPPVEVDASRAGVASVDRGFAVRLRGPLETSTTERAVPGVTLVDYEHLQATVQDGLDAGTYDLLVVGPDGSIGELSEAFTITDTRVDRIATSVDSVVYEVFDTAWIDISLADPEGDRVLQPMRVAIDVLDAEGRGVTLTPDVLDDITLAPDGIGLEGELDASGFGRVGLSVGTPGMIDLVVSPLDAEAAVADSLVRILWEPGSELFLEVLLPDDSGDMEVAAGEPFDVTLHVRDQFGNLVEDVAQPVLLIDECQTWFAEVEVQGTATVEAQLTAATGTTGCEEEYIRSLAGLQGRSADITVVPGPARAFDVSVYAKSVVAGEQTNTFVTPIDDYDNVSTWSGDLESLRVTDSVDGVIDAECFGDPGQVFCFVRQAVAADEVQITVSAASVSGTSNAFAVLPAPVHDIDLALSSAGAVAGEPLEVTVALFDEYENPVDATDQVDDLWFDVVGGTGSCVFDRIDAPEAVYACTFESAREGEQVRVTHLRTETDALSDAFDVVNGALAVAALTLPAEPAVAGEPIEVDVAAFDAYGNAYVVQDKLESLTLADTTAAAVPVAVALDADGTATTALTLTVAGQTEVVAEALAGEVGRVGPIEVVAGEGSVLDVSIAEPWGWVGLPVPFDVVARDAWGNQAAVDEVVELVATSGLADDVSVSLVGGQAQAELVWTDTEWTDSVSATSEGGLTGTSAVFAVVEDCGGSGPGLEVSFSGLDYAVACWDADTESATLLASMSATPGSAAILWYGVAVGDGPLASSVTTPVTALTSETGVLPVRALAAQLDGCATEVAATAYVAPDDGQPVGPLEVVPTDDTLDVGLDSTTVDLIGATDCSGDASVGGAVAVFAERGEVVGASPTGTGLEVSLDASGDASFTVDASLSGIGGDTLVAAWVEGGAAYGEAAIGLVGDHLRPVVLEQEPAGDTVGDIDVVEITFDEALWNVAPALFSITGPDTVTIADVVAVDDRVVRIELEEPVTAEAGVWTVGVRADLRDLAGNRLDGAWSGAASDYALPFGDLPSAATPVDSCEPDTYTFRPDGDDGAGEEADEVVLTLTTATAPAWWVVRVEGDGEEVVAHARVPGAGSVESWAWDGRDARGAIVDDGLYSVVVDSEDADGNRGGACSTVVSVDNRIGP